MAIDEGLFVDINGIEQWITIRGRDRRNPVLLLLHGGPGFPMSFMAPAFASWERDFTLVQWDQPGGGATWSKNAASGHGPMNVERFVADGIAVTEWVRNRLHTQKVVLMGSSWLLNARRDDGPAPSRVVRLLCRHQPGGQRAGRRKAGLSACAGSGAHPQRRRSRDRAGADRAAALFRFEDFLVRQQYTNPPGLPPTPEES